jgi:hypothetical protein
VQFSLASFLTADSFALRFPQLRIPPSVGNHFKNNDYADKYIVDNFIFAFWQLENNGS